LQFSEKFLRLHWFYLGVPVAAAVADHTSSRFLVHPKNRYRAGVCVEWARSPPGWDRDL